MKLITEKIVFALSLSKSSCANLFFTTLKEKKSKSLIYNLLLFHLQILLEKHRKKRTNEQTKRNENVFVSQTENLQIRSRMLHLQS
jgi:hypothetical protein